MERLLGAPPLRGRSPWVIRSIRARQPRRRTGAAEEIEPALDPAEDPHVRVGAVHVAEALLARQFLGEEGGQTRAHVRRDGELRAHAVIDARGEARDVHAVTRIGTTIAGLGDPERAPSGAETDPG